jgi:hypothetical protein
MEWIEFIRPIADGLSLAIKKGKTCSDYYCNSREILILLWPRKAWLRSQAFYPPLAD